MTNDWLIPEDARKLSQFGERPMTLKQDTRDAISRFMIACGITDPQLPIALATAEDRNLWAWITFLMKAAPDRADWFPHGKWATIQAIEDQLYRLALAQVQGQWVRILPENVEGNQISAPRGNAQSVNSPPYGRIEETDPAA